MSAQIFHPGLKNLQNYKWREPIFIAHTRSLLPPLHETQKPGSETQVFLPSSSTPFSDPSSSRSRILFFYIHTESSGGWWWMAKNNKYASINFNHIYEKSTTNPSSSSTKGSSSSLSPSYPAASYSAVSSNKGHGRMLVLTRPSPKPVSTPAPQPQQPPPQPQPKPIHQAPNQPQSESGSDAISLRPLGHTGTGPSLPSPVLNHEKEKELPPLLTSPKSDKFVPPHLRPGFVRREEKHGPEMVHRQQGYAGPAGRFAEDRRPKSGGYDRMRMGGDAAMINRPRSSGSRPGSSGWYVCFLIQI